jgi:hypothetical protein
MLLQVCCIGRPWQGARTLPTVRVLLGVSLCCQAPASVAEERMWLGVYPVVAVEVVSTASSFGCGCTWHCACIQATSILS